MQRRTDSPDFQKLYAGTFPDVLGVDITASESGLVEGTLEVGRQHLAPNGFMHAGVVVGFADTLCGLGSADNLPENAVGFTTIELKANFMGTARGGSIKG
ncbi:MAG: PaaI family thioesterase, partial [Acidimicrobiia bacterium]